MIRIELKITEQAVAHISNTLLIMPSIVQNAVEMAEDEFRQRQLPNLQKEPGKVKLPIQWTKTPDGKDKQRKAFFATKGFGHGIPYHRSGKLANAWRVYTETFSTGARLIVNNPSDNAGFVYGQFSGKNRQQQFHVNTGWQTISKDTQKYIKFILETIQDDISQQLNS